MSNIEDNPIYKEELIRHAARLDEEERRAAAKEEKEARKKMWRNIMTYIYGLIIFLFLMFTF